MPPPLSGRAGRLALLFSAVGVALAIATVEPAGTEAASSVAGAPMQQPALGECRARANKGGPPDVQRGVTGQVSLVVQAENGAGAGRIKPRSRALGDRTVLICDGETWRLQFAIDRGARFGITVRYSNDNGVAGGRVPSETVSVSIDGSAVGRYHAQNTRPRGRSPGEGWNVFRSTGVIGSRTSRAGVHSLTLRVSGGDGFGVEIDAITLRRS